ncbi:MAG: OB-fold domain-containing protein [Microthrixaceae bacterium]|nr:OB-fold domain-containing protein [Microthrixaceae bacterium]
MSTATTRRRPAVEGWFTMPEPGTGESPHLIGTRCAGSGTFFFPPERVMSRAPGFAGSQLEEVLLSNRGRLWSWTDAQYQPPPPYVPVSDPHEPFCIAAVELEAEQMVVLGQVRAGVSVDDLELGMEMELVLDPCGSNTTTTRARTSRWSCGSGYRCATQGKQATATTGRPSDGGRSGNRCRRGHAPMGQVG